MANVPGTIFLHNTITPVLIWTLESGGTSTSGSFVTDDSGRIPGWVDIGQVVDITIFPAPTVTVNLGVILSTSANTFLQPQTFQNSTALTFNSGGSPKYPIAAASNLVLIDQYGNLLAGQNNLVTSHTPSTLQTVVADFAYLQGNPRLLTRNLTLTEIDDPPDLTFRRFGPVGGYPYSGGFGLASPTTSSSITITNTNNPNALSNFATGQVFIGDATTGIPAGTTITSLNGGPSGSTITLTLSASITAASNAAVFSIGRPSDLTSVGAGGTIGQVRCSPPITPYLGTVTTPGAKALQISASIGFRTTELPRDLTGGQDLAMGTQMRFSTTPNGRQIPDAVMVLSSDGNLQVGRGSVNAGDTDDILQVRGFAGQDEILQFTSTGSPTGSFTISFVGDPPTDGYATPVTTGTLNPASAVLGGDIATALAALETGAPAALNCAYANGSTLVTIVNPNGQIPKVGATVVGPGGPGANGIQSGTTVAAGPAPTAAGFSLSQVTNNNSNNTALTISNWRLGLDGTALTITGGPLPTPINVEFHGPYYGDHHFVPFVVNGGGVSGGSVGCNSTQTGIPNTSANRLLLLRRENVSPTQDYFTVQDGNGNPVLALNAAGTLVGGGVVTQQSGNHTARLAATPTLNLLWQETDTGLIYHGNASTWDIWKAEGTVRKTGTQTVNNSNTPVNDTDLHFPIEINEVWFVEVIMLTGASSPNADWLVGWSGPTGATADWGVLAASNVVPGGEFEAMLSSSTGLNQNLTISQTATFAGMNGKQLTRAGGIFVADGTHPGTITFQWAQNTPTVENNLVLANSLLLLKRIL